MRDEPIIYTVLAGSRGQGLATEESDFDYVQVFVEPPERVFSDREPTRPTHFKHDTGDTHSYPLRRFLGLAVKGNPSVLEAFWTPQIEVWAMESWKFNLGTELRDLREYLIGSHVIKPYQGYMRAQALRLLGLKGGHSAGKEKRKTASSEIAGYDTKYAAHILRLGYNCLQLLTDGHLEPFQEGDDRRKTIMSVRRGELDFADFFEEALAVDAAIALHQPNIPEGPNERVVWEWSHGAHLHAWMNRDR
jgi:hypothetical protein